MKITKPTRELIAEFTTATRLSINDAWGVYVSPETDIYTADLCELSTLAQLADTIAQLAYIGANPLKPFNYMGRVYQLHNLDVTENGGYYAQYQGLHEQQEFEAFIKARLDIEYSAVVNTYTQKDENTGVSSLGRFSLRPNGTFTIDSCTSSFNKDTGIITEGKLSWNEIERLEATLALIREHRKSGELTLKGVS